MDRVRFYFVVSLSALAFLPSVIEGAISCYCNDQQCANLGFVCVSHSNWCFSKLYSAYHSDSKTTTRQSDDVHGCVDQLPEAQSGICNGYSAGDLVKPSETRDGVILCCSDVLCNYKPSQDIRVDVAKLSLNSSGEKMSPQSWDHRKQQSTESWFTATVIAVPVVGGLILMVLVLIAIRMLQHDRRRLDRQRSVAKARLFIENHFAKSVAPNGSSPTYPCAQLSCRDVMTQVSNLEEGLGCSLKEDSAAADGKSNSVLMWNDSNYEYSARSALV